MDLLVANLSRMNEEEESDRQGVYHTLGIFENTIGFNPELATIVMQKTSILKWLLTRLQAKKHDENRGYVAELLPILLQGSQENGLMFGKNKGIDVLLQVLSVCLTSNTKPLLSLNSCSSNTEERTLLMQMRSNSWKMYLMHCVLFSLSLRISKRSSRKKAVRLSVRFTS